MSRQNLEDLRARLETVSKDYQKAQDDIQAAVETHQRLDSQVNENQAVKKEFANLKPHNTIYKMIGPVLVKQDPEEAKSNVDKRIEFIKGEITRVEQQISELNLKSEKIKAEVVTIQNVIASQQPQLVSA
ncbi:unnamed protein product [Rhizoctonia solani]|uniref:Prefoldin subunit 6 n=1 Tax=Rhizoctonia solani TaxID=456999 RepID=A0A8H3CII3_9AGAM|nr:unnamed protein product [Rhizoctonia solani]